MRTLSDLERSKKTCSITISLSEDTSIRSIRNEDGTKPNKFQLGYTRNVALITGYIGESNFPHHDNEGGPSLVEGWKDRFKALFGCKLEDPLKDLKDLVSLLSNVTSVRWIASSLSCPRAITNSIIEIVASLPSLDTFLFEVTGRGRFTLPNLPRVKSLSLRVYDLRDFWTSIVDPLILVMKRNSELEDLCLDFVGIKETLSFAGFLHNFPTTQPLKLRKLSFRTHIWNFQIDNESGIHLKNLTTLELRFTLGLRAPNLATYSTCSGALWTALSYHGTELKHLYAPVSTELIDYLETYSGIEYLRLYGTAGAELAHQFQNHVLRLHATSLKVLNTSLVIGGLDKPWVFKDHPSHRLSPRGSRTMLPQNTLTLKS